MNCSLLSEIILSDNICSFQMLSLNNYASSFTVIPFVIVTKYTIFNNLLHTTSITFFSIANGSSVMKFTIRCVYSFLISCLLLVSLLVSLFCFLFFDTSYSYPHIFICLQLSLATNNFLLPALLFSIIHHIPLLVHYSVTG